MSAEITIFQQSSTVIVIDGHKINVKLIHTDHPSSKFRITMSSYEYNDTTFTSKIDELPIIFDHMFDQAKKFFAEHHVNKTKFNQLYQKIKNYGN